MFGLSSKKTLPTPDDALAGRPEPLPGIPTTHEVLGTPLHGPWPEGTRVLYVAMGCFWGAERIFWQLPGVVTTAAGYMGGLTPNATYDEVCSGRTGHTEAVLVAYDPAVTSAETLLAAFWENHDPTQGFRQGNDVGSQYRSAIYWTTDEQHAAALASRDAYGKRLAAAGYGNVTTEIEPAASNPWFYAEAAHQQYLYKNPNGYCGIGGTGVTCQVGSIG